MLPMRPIISRHDVSAAGVSAVAEAPTTRTAAPASASTLDLEEATTRGEDESRCVGAMLGAMCGNVLGAAVQNDRHYQVGVRCSIQDPACLPSSLSLMLLAARFRHLPVCCPCCLSHQVVRRFPTGLTDFWSFDVSNEPLAFGCYSGARLPLGCLSLIQGFIGHG